jgi:plasmid stability protein
MTMASITIRNLDDEVKTRLRVRAAEHHRSMEEEVRVTLRDAVDAGRNNPRDSGEQCPF